jgi:hypothetical protein
VTVDQLAGAADGDGQLGCDLLHPAAGVAVDVAHHLEATHGQVMPGPQPDLEVVPQPSLESHQVVEHHRELRLGRMVAGAGRGDDRRADHSSSLPYRFRGIWIHLAGLLGPLQ